MLVVRFVVLFLFASRGHRSSIVLPLCIVHVLIVRFVVVVIPSSSSFIRSFVHSSIRSFAHAFIRSLVPSPLRVFVPSFIPSFVHSFVRSFIRSFVRSFVRVGRCVVVSM